MSQLTIQKIFGASPGGLDKAVELNNTEATRRLLMGTNWTHLAIGIRADVSVLQNTNLVSPGFNIGVCHDLKGPKCGALCDHFVGYNAGEQSSTSLAIETGSTRYRACLTETSMRTKRIQNGAVVTGSFSTGSALYYATVGGAIPSADTTAYPVPMIVSIRKVGSTYYVDNVLSGSGTYSSAACTEAKLVQALQTGSMENAETYLLSEVGTYRFEYNPGGSQVVSEATYGELDCVCLSWPNAVVPLNIYSFLVCKWA
ncbi:MAG: hypothetical protein H7A46_26125 [Verrucomicrobiales bacterium]|nr:hypothetical protein [Verrucomicrobiales bacterium]